VENLGPGRGILAFRLKDADAGQVAVALGEVESVADDKLVRDIKTNEVRGKLHGAPGFFIEKHGGPDGFRVHGLQAGNDLGERGAGIEDIVNEEDMAVFQVEPDPIDDFRFTLLRGSDHTCLCHPLIRTPSD